MASFEHRLPHRHGKRTRTRKHAVTEEEEEGEDDGAPDEESTQLCSERLLVRLRASNIPRAAYDAVHPSPLAFAFAKDVTHISHDGHYLIAITHMSRDTLRVHWKYRSSAMLALGCDACVMQHQPSRKHCSASGDNGGALAGFLSTLPELPANTYQFYTLDLVRTNDDMDDPGQRVRLNGTWYLEELHADGKHKSGSAVFSKVGD